MVGEKGGGCLRVREKGGSVFYCWGKKGGVCFIVGGKRGRVLKGWGKRERVL